MAPSLLIRADGGPEIGWGHLVRCLALAQAWQGEVTLRTKELPAELADVFRDAAVVVESVSGTAGGEADAKATRLHSAGVGASWVVVDGYHFDAAFIEAIRCPGTRILHIDDMARATSAADVVLNQNHGARRSLYRGPGPIPALLLGPRFALIRREVRALRGPVRTPNLVRRVLVTAGGGSSPDLLGKIVGALRATGWKGEVRLVGRAESIPPGPKDTAGGLRLVVVPPPARMAEELASADLVLSAAGSIAWETCCIGVPAVLFPISENQRPVAEAVAADGAALLGDFSAPEQALANLLRAVIEDADLRARLARVSSGLVDGLGASRVRAFMQSLDIRLREATMADARLIWEWANEPTTRALSFRPEPIDWETHLKWMERKVADAACTMWMIEAPALGRASPIGVLRIEHDETHAGVVSVNMAAEARGHGLGAAALRAASERYLRNHADVLRVDAFIKPRNAASAGAFENAGFRFMEDLRIEGQQAWRYAFARDDLS